MIATALVGRCFSVSHMTCVLKIAASQSFARHLKLFRFSPLQVFMALLSFWRVSSFSANLRVWSSPPMCLTLPSPLFNRLLPCPRGSINIISSSRAADTNQRVTINNSSSVLAPCSGIHTAWALLSRLGAMDEISSSLISARAILIARLRTFAAQKPWSLPHNFLSRHHAGCSRVPLLLFILLSAFVSGRCSEADPSKPPSLFFCNHMYLVLSDLGHCLQIEWQSPVCAVFLLMLYS